MSGDTIHRLELAIRIVVPDDFSGCRGVRSQMTIERTGEHGPGDCRYGRGLCRTAWPAVLTTRRRRLPDRLPVIDTESEHAATFSGIQLIFTIVRPRL